MACNITSLLLTRSLYAIAVPSVCRLYVCNVRVTYSDGWNFRQFFFAVWYLRHWHSLKILRRSGDLNARGVAKCSDYWHLECC